MATKIKYVWTKLMEKISSGKKKAGEQATLGGKTLHEKNVIAGWKEKGYIEEAEEGALR